MVLHSRGTHGTAHSAPDTPFQYRTNCTRYGISVPPIAPDTRWQYHTPCRIRIRTTHRMSGPDFAHCTRYVMSVSHTAHSTRYAMSLHRNRCAMPVLHCVYSTWWLVVAPYAYCEGRSSLVASYASQYQAFHSKRIADIVVCSVSPGNRAASASAPWW